VQKIGNQNGLKTGAKLTAPISFTPVIKDLTQ